jgi:hypothetical protein
VGAISALVLASCGGSPTSRAQAPQASVPASVASAPDPFAVPATINKPYVQKVLDAIEQVEAGATQEVVATRSVDNTAALRMRAVDGDAEFQFEVNGWLNEIQSGLSHVRSNPGAARDRVATLFRATSSCVFLSAVRDISAVAVTPPAPRLTYIELVQLAPKNDPTHLNPTGWAIAEAGWNSQGLQPSDPCPSAP